MGCGFPGTLWRHIVRLFNNRKQDGVILAGTENSKHEELLEKLASWYPIPLTSFQKIMFQQYLTIMLSMFRLVVKHTPLGCSIQQVKKTMIDWDQWLILILKYFLFATAWFYLQASKMPGKNGFQKLGKVTLKHLFYWSELKLTEERTVIQSHN